MSNQSGAGPVLEAEGLEKRYHDGRRTIEVLRGLSLSVAGAASVAIVGQSGVGKSTLLHLLGALDTPDAGTVRLEGQDLFSMQPTALAALRNRSIGFVFQFHHLLGDFDALENVMMPLLVGGIPWGQARQRAGELLERVGLAERANHRPGELSGGEQQRVAVARAVATRPCVVLADEPTGNLDPTSARQVHEMLRQVQREERCALVVATHNATLAGMMDVTYTVREGVLLPGARV